MSHQYDGPVVSIEDRPANAGAVPRALEGKVSSMKKVGILLTVVLVVGIVAVASTLGNGGSSTQAGNDSSGDRAEAFGADGTNEPGYSPTSVGGNWPTPEPTSSPTRGVSWPTAEPTSSPSFTPTNWPTPGSGVPTSSPTDDRGDPFSPTNAPSKYPTTQRPTTKSPTNAPSKSPTTQRPTTNSPTNSPTNAPSKSPTQRPTTNSPTNAPSKSPTQRPTTLSPTLSPSRAPTYGPVATCQSPYPSENPGCISLQSLWRGDRPLYKALVKGLGWIRENIAFACRFELESDRDSAVGLGALYPMLALIDECLRQLVLEKPVLRETIAAIDVLLSTSKSSVCFGKFKGKDIIKAPEQGMGSGLYHGQCSKIPLDPNGEFTVLSYSIPAPLMTPVCPVGALQPFTMVSGCLVIGRCGPGKPTVAFAFDKGTATCVAGNTITFGAGVVAGGAVVVGGPVGAAVAGSYVVGGAVAAGLTCGAATIGAGAVYSSGLGGPALAAGGAGALGVALVLGNLIDGAVSYGFSPNGLGFKSSVYVWDGQTLGPVPTKTNVVSTKVIALDSSKLFPVGPYARIQGAAEAHFSIRGPNRYGLLQQICDENADVPAILESITNDVQVSMWANLEVELGLSSMFSFFPKMQLELKQANALLTLAPKRATGVQRGLHVLVKDNRDALEVAQRVVLAALAPFGEVLRLVFPAVPNLINQLAANTDTNNLHALFALTAGPERTGFKVRLPLLSSFVMLNEPGALNFKCVASLTGTRRLRCELKIAGLSGKQVLGGVFTIVKEAGLFVCHLGGATGKVLAIVAEQFVSELHDCTIGLTDDFSDCIVFNNRLIQRTAELIEKKIAHGVAFVQGIHSWAKEALSWCGFQLVTDALTCGTKRVRDGIKCGFDFIRDPACGFITVTDKALCGAEFVTEASICGVEKVFGVLACGIDKFWCKLTRCKAECYKPKTCERVNTCSVPKKCDIPRSCNIAMSCNQPRRC